MSSEQQDVAKSDFSPVLFMSVDGEPMTFFLRPGHVKRKLQPLITAGAGMLCNAQQPGAIMLIDPEERSSIPETTAHWYVSTQYIYDCIDQDKQLNLEDYRLNPEVVPRQSARLNKNKENSPIYSGGTESVSVPEGGEKKKRKLGNLELAMKEFEDESEDLVSVTKALLKTSGDLSDARNLLLNPSSFPGMLWKHCDDDLLRSGDPVVRKQLLEKYSEEGVAKRIVFLDLER